MDFLPQRLHCRSVKSADVEYKVGEMLGRVGLSRLLRVFTQARDQVESIVDSFLVGFRLSVRIFQQYRLKLF